MRMSVLNTICQRHLYENLYLNEFKIKKVYYETTSSKLKLIIEFQFKIHAANFKQKAR